MITDTRTAINIPGEATKLDEEAVCFQDGVKNISGKKTPAEHPTGASVSLIPADKTE